MTPDERHSVLSALARQRGGDLKIFFVSQGLGYAFENEMNRLDNRSQKVADAIDAAERRDGDDRVLLAAVESFRLSELLVNYVSPGLPELLEELDRRVGWDIVQRTLETAAADVHLDPAGAITASRAAIESVCKHICEERDVGYRHSDRLTTLYGKAAESLNLSPQQQDDPVIRQLLQGAVTVVGGLAALRNSYGDAHGKGKTSPDTPATYGALAVNMAVGITRLLLEAHDRQEIAEP